MNEDLLNLSYSDVIFIPVFLIFFAGKSISEIHMKARRKSGGGERGWMAYGVEG